MKKLFYLLLFVSFNLFAQPDSTAVEGTTIEEYNYLTKGYKIQIESGLDMKKGYVLKNVPGYFSDKMSYTNDNLFKRESNYKLLYKDGSTKPCAILMILTVYHKSKLTGTHYFCIPTYNSNLWLNFKEDLYKVYMKNYETNTQLNRVDLFQHYINSLKMISYCLTAENIK